GESAAVVEAALLQRQRFGFALQMAFGYFADHHAMVAELVEADHLAFERGRSLADDRRAILSRFEGVGAELAIDRFDMFEERGADRFLTRAEHREREDFGLLDQRMRGRVCLDPDHYQRRLEARLGEPVDGRDRLLVAVARA